MIEMKAVLEEVKQACLYVDDDNNIGVTVTSHISHELFDRICSVLNKHPESWVKCETCNGFGRVEIVNTMSTTLCDECDGMGGKLI
jgi:DnaJ-class molecular chaperone